LRSVTILTYLLIATRLRLLTVYDVDGSVIIRPSLSHFWLLFYEYKRIGQQCDEYGV